MPWVFENTLIAGCLALIVWLISRFGGVAPVIRHALWLVVLIKLITPPVLSLEIPIPAAWREIAWFESRAEDFTAHSESRVVEQTFETNSGIETAGIDFQSPANDAWQFSEGPVSRAEFTFAVDEASSNAEVSGERNDRSAATAEVPALPLVHQEPPSCKSALEPIVCRIVLWLAFTGTCVLAMLQLLRLARLRGLLRRTVAPESEFTGLVKELSACLRIRPPDVRVSHDVQSPFVCALGRAVLVWPASGLPSLRGDSLRGVIVHELAHLARRDHWVGWLELVASCAWWWNPLFWYVRRQLHENAELACDAWALELVPDGTRDYARALVDLAELDSRLTAAVPALGVGDGSRKLFERRLVMILGERVQYRIETFGRAEFGLLGLLALIGCSASFAGDETAAVKDEAAPGRTGAPINTPAAAEPAAAESTPRALPNPVVEKAPPLGLALPVAQDTATPVAQAPPVSNEDRLKRLEDKFDALLTELRELKSGAAKPPAKPNAVDPRSRDSKVWAGTGTRDAPTGPKNKGPVPRTPDPNTTVTKNPDGTVTTESKWPVPYKHTGPQPQAIDDHRFKTRVAGANRGGEPVTVELTRATYKLPAGKADEIAAFLKAQLTDDVEVRVKDGALQITANAGDQKVISQFIHLLQSRSGTATKIAPKRDETRYRTLPDAQPGGADAFEANPATSNRVPPVVAPPAERLDRDNLPETTPARR